MRAARRIHLCGSPGSGKSTLARTLGESLALPVIHLDCEFWQPGWVQTPLPEWFEKTAALAERDSWIIDGNYSRTLDLRLPYAGAVILLDLPRWRCFWRILKRRFQHSRRPRLDMPAGCPEHLDWPLLKQVWRFPDKERLITIRAINNMDPGKLVLVFRKPAELQAFLDQLHGGR